MICAWLNTTSNLEYHGSKNRFQWTMTLYDNGTAVSKGAIFPITSGIRLDTNTKDYSSLISMEVVGKEAVALNFTKNETSGEELSGLYKENDKQVNEPFSDRVNLALLYLSAQMVHSESKEATAALFSPKFEGINEIGCTWTSRKSERSYTECCSVDT